MCSVPMQMVRVDGGVARGAGEVQVLAAGNVLEGVRVAVLLGEPQVDPVHEVALLPDAHQEVVCTHEHI